MRIDQIFDEYGVSYYTAGSPNTSEGWISLACPFCRDRSNHLGVHIESGRFYCWRCGKHSVIECLTEILGVSKKQAKRLLDKFQVNRRKVPEKKITQTDNKVVFPSNYSQVLFKPFKDYLRSRGFTNPDKLAKEWDIGCTGKNAYLGDADYSVRLIFPIYWQGKLVSWQSRKILDSKPGVSYKACKKEFERIRHQHIFFNNKNYDGSTVFICEGVIDCLKVGKSAIATFGIGVTRQQISAISQIYDKAFVLFDPEYNAQKEAKKLVRELNFRGMMAKNINIKDFSNANDPGDMTQKEVDDLLLYVKN